MADRHHPKFDFSQVTENIFLGTNLCCKMRSHIQELLDIGVTAEIDLEEERQDAAPEVPVYLWLPVMDKTAPAIEQLEAGVALIERMVKIGKKVYVHCKNGHGRSPTMVAAYLISQGKSVEEVIDTIKQSRPEIHPEESQIEVLKLFSKQADHPGAS